MEYSGQDPVEDTGTVVKRRTDASISPRTLVQEVRHAPVHPPWKRVRLERNSFVDYRQRSVSANVSVAEFYHENSKLFPQMLPELTALSTKADAFRHEVIRDRVTDQANAAVEIDLDTCWRKLLSSVIGAIDLELFYAVELRVAAGELLAVHEPVSDTLQVVKQLSAADWIVLRRALQLMVTGQNQLHLGPLLFILGRFAWNDVLLGPRGYRRTLLEAGQVAQEIICQAKQFDVAVAPLHEFIDRDLDVLMEADGIEEGTLMVFELGGGGGDVC